MILSDFKTDKLNVKVFETRNELGQEAAKEAQNCILNLLAQKEEINILFAAAPSQNEFLQALRGYKLPWNRINALHMDEYIGLSKDAPQRFGTFLNQHIFEHLSFKLKTPFRIDSCPVFPPEITHFSLVIPYCLA